MQPVVTGSGQGEQIWFGGGCMTVKVSSADTDGAVAMIVDVAARGKTTPLHLHESFDETFYVLEGELLVHIDGEEHPAPAGSVAFVPRGLAHAFLVTSEQARFI